MQRMRELPRLMKNNYFVLLLCRYQVQQSGVSEDMLARTITEKLNDTPGVSYSEIANHAFECGKVDLAIQVC